MSKLSFRARALDASKPLPVYHADELPDLSEYNAINRAVPEMPTGMEKEEETEHHLQRAMAAQQLYGAANQLVIPTPEFNVKPISDYTDVYQKNYETPRTYIRMNGLMLDVDSPDYDLDDEDEEWCKSQDGLNPLELETMLETLEKGLGQQSQNLSLVEAQALLQGDDEDLVVKVFDFWQAKRARLKIPLIAAVKQEKRDGSSATDYYVAFRRRTEKMQTRKNRKNDEASYERMCKLKRDLERSCQLITMIKEREQKKQELLVSMKDIFCQRYKMRDWNCSAYNSVMGQLFRPARVIPPHPAQAQATSMMDHAYNHQVLPPGQQQVGYPGHTGYPVAGAPGMNTNMMPMRSIASSGETSAVGGGPVAGDAAAMALWSQQPAAEGAERPSKSKDRHSSKRRHHKKKHHSSPQPPVEAPSAITEEGPTEQDLMTAHVDTPQEVPGGPFAFKRRLHVLYCPARESLNHGWPFEEAYPDLPSNKRYRLYLTSMGRAKPFLGLGRQRAGRADRHCIDRGPWPFGGGGDLAHDIRHGYARVHDVLSDDDTLNYYQLDSPPPAKRVAMPPSPSHVYKPESRESVDDCVHPVSMGLSSFTCRPLTPSSSGDTVDTEEDDVDEEDADEAGTCAVFPFGDYATSVCLSSSIPSGVVHKTPEADSGLESNGVSPLSDDQQCQSLGQSSGGNHSPSVSPHAADDIAVGTSRRPMGSASSSSEQQRIQAPGASDSHTSQTAAANAGYLSVLSRTAGSSWLGSSSSTPAIHRVSPSLAGPRSNSQSPIPNPLKVL